MSSKEYFQLVSDFARELTKGDISLPSFPEVVLRIRKLLEKDDVLIEQVSGAVSTDPVLVSRLLVFANSSHHNPAGVRIESLDVAISRLGFELVKNTAVSLAIKQIALAEQHKDIAPQMRAVWQRSMQLAAMSSVVAARKRGLDKETAFLCGLLHQVGKLYILTRSKDYPALLADPEQFDVLADDWHPKVGKSIVESWNFPDEVVRTLEPDEHLSDFTHEDATLVDVVYVAGQLLKFEDNDDDGAAVEALLSEPAATRIGIAPENIAGLRTAYNEKLSAVREALTT